MLPSRLEVARTGDSRKSFLAIKLKPPRIYNRQHHPLSLNSGSIDISVQTFPYHVQIHHISSHIVFVFTVCGMEGLAKGSVEEGADSSCLSRENFETLTAEKAGGELSIQAMLFSKV